MGPKSYGKICRYSKATLDKLSTKLASFKKQREQSCFDRISWEPLKMLGWSPTSTVCNSRIIGNILLYEI